jgi:hypothetical protein
MLAMSAAALFHGTEAVAPPRFVDLVVEKLDAGEMPGWSALLPHPVSGSGRVGGVGCEAFEKVASVERIGSRDGQPAQAERKRLERDRGLAPARAQNRASA